MLATEDSGLIALREASLLLAEQVCLAFGDLGLGAEELEVLFERDSSSKVDFAADLLLAERD